MTRWIFPLGLAVIVGGCALKGDVRKVESQVAQLRAETARADSARAADLDSLAADLSDLNRVLAQAIVGFLNAFRGEVRGDMLSIQEQLVQIQELTGQNQRRLNEFRMDLSQRREQIQRDTIAPVANDATDMYNVSMAQLRRGSVTTARVGFRAFLTQHPEHELVPDALFHIGETFEQELPDSAIVVFEQVAEQFLRLPGRQRTGPQSHRCHYGGGVVDCR